MGKKIKTLKKIDFDILDWHDLNKKQKTLRSKIEEFKTAKSDLQKKIDEGEAKLQENTVKKQKIRSYDLTKEQRKKLELDRKLKEVKKDNKETKKQLSKNQREQTKLEQEIYKYEAKIRKIEDSIEKKRNQINSDIDVRIQNLNSYITAGKIVGKLERDLSKESEELRNLHEQKKILNPQKEYSVQHAGIANDTNSALGANEQQSANKQKPPVESQSQGEQSQSEQSQSEQSQSKERSNPKDASLEQGGGESIDAAVGTSSPVRGDNRQQNLSAEAAAQDSNEQQGPNNIQNNPNVQTTNPQQQAPYNAAAYDGQENSIQQLAYFLVEKQKETLKKLTSGRQNDHQDAKETIENWIKSASQEQKTEFNKLTNQMANDQRSMVDKMPKQSMQSGQKNEIKDADGKVALTLEPQEKTKDGRTYRNVKFPDQLNVGSKGPIDISLALKDDDGNNMPENKAVYLSAHYNEDGKLVGMTTPMPIYFDPKKGGNAIGYIEQDGKIYTLPVNKDQYQEMLKNIEKNQGFALDCSCNKELQPRQHAQQQNLSEDKVQAKVDDVKNSLVAKNAHISTGPKKNGMTSQAQGI